MKAPFMQRVYTAGAYPGYCRLVPFLLPLDGMLVHHRATHSIKFCGGSRGSGGGGGAHGGKGWKGARSNLIKQKNELGGDAPGSPYRMPPKSAPEPPSLKYRIRKKG